MPIANKIKRLLGWEATRTEPMAEKKAKELIQIRYNPSTGVSGNDRRVRGAAWIDSSHAERWLLLITATLGRLGARNFGHEQAGQLFRFVEARPWSKVIGIPKVISFRTSCSNSTQNAEPRQPPLQYYCFAY